jgi:hypothetical protein
MPCSPGERLGLSIRPPHELEIESGRALQTGDETSARNNARVVVDADVSGPPSCVRVDARHLHDALATVKSDRVELLVTDHALVLRDGQRAQHALVRQASPGFPGDLTGFVQGLPAREVA